LKKILFISLAVVLGLSVGLIGCDGGGPAAPTAIKVGLVRDLSGPLVFYDWASGGPVYRALNKTINDAGGIYMSGYGEKLPLELKINQYDLSAADLQLQTESLITDWGAHFIFGGPGTTTIYTQAAVCDAYGVILMTLEGGATDMMADPEKLASWSNTFINLSFSDWYQVPVMWEMLKDQGIAEPKAYVIYINNEHGQEYNLTTENVFGAGNVSSHPHAWTATYEDIEDQINEAIVALNQSGSGPDYDVFCAYTYDPILSDVVTVMADLDFDPPAILMGPGATGGVYLLVHGANLDGMCGFAVANNKSDVSPETQSMTFTEMWNIVMPEGSGPFPPFTYWDVWGHPPQFAGLEMWAEAVETVGHLDAGYTAEVRSVLVGFNETNPCTTVLGDTWYEVLGGGLGGGVIDYQCMPGQIAQWQNNYCEIVGYTDVTDDIPKYDVTAAFDYPYTGKWNWLP
jgi:hypothetical protein